MERGELEGGAPAAGGAPVVVRWRPTAVRGGSTTAGKDVFTPEPFLDLLNATRKLRSEVRKYDISSDQFVTVFLSKTGKLDEMHVGQDEDVWIVW
ncbi:hypothetical protein QVD17_39356 [Tagetes erecta]|uniref:Uncharacterized protein n=1 Tax=Tagetes erecta TaxID=13708 RepID=A0AAD8NG58_TARER|nr:hypothetical protein QVD17_39356 [Tagetes erecta]